MIEPIRETPYFLQKELEWFGLEGEPVLEPSDFTCYECGCATETSPWKGSAQHNCEFAWDGYNTDGDCLNDK